jgi:hypothetical protein
VFRFSHFLKHERMATCFGFSFAVHFLSHQKDLHKNLKLISNINQIRDENGTSLLYTYLRVL